MWPFLHALPFQLLTTFPSLQTKDTQRHSRIPPIPARTFESLHILDTFTWSTVDMSYYENQWGGPAQNNWDHQGSTTPVRAGMDFFSAVRNVLTGYGL